MPLQGTFDVLDFTDVLHLLARQQLTGRLHVRSRSFGANLFLEDGLLVGADQSEHQPAATAGDVRGRIEEICFEMLEAERGSFEFHAGKATTVPVNERHTPEDVLGRAAKRLEEWHELQRVIPSLELQPRLVLDLAGSEVTLDKERWRMLTAIDGRRNLRAIGRALNLSDFDVCRIMRVLLENNIVELEGLAALPASSRDAMPVVPPPDASGMERVVAERVSPPPPAEGGGGVAAEGAAVDDEPEDPTGPVPVTAGSAGADAPDRDLTNQPESDPPAPRHGRQPVSPEQRPRNGAGSSPGPAGPAEAPEAPADAEAPDGEGGSGRRGRRVIRIRSRQPDPGRA
ncbi:MAG TPA: DUF4388 domain-containing protein [Acidimicrobiales bacterium]|nr:DUF4388 domain-containing protein [Acidimicrobiales bacterium]